MIFLKKNMLIFYYVSIILTVSLQSTIQGLADWTIVTYIQADNNLAPFAEYNISEMQAIKANANLNILVQWHHQSNKEVERYSITAREVKKDGQSFAPRVKTPDLDLADAMKWAAKDYPAKHYMLVLWNHGNGILDESWYKRGRRDFYRTPIHDIPWLEIPGLPITTPRGILYSEATNSYMNNQQLASALHTISTDILGKKIDIIGMDACLMAMLEVGYQIKDYANILVASQNSEPGRGWNYANLLRRISSRTTITPELMAQKILNTFSTFYKSHVSFYTQSAIDLSYMDTITNNLDEIIQKINDCKEIFSQKTTYYINLARSISVKFDTPSYLDLHSFYQGLVKVTQPKTTNEKVYNPSKNKGHYEKKIKSLQQSLYKGMKLIEKSVIANAVGPHVKRAQGISIYFPQFTIHESYPKTKFAEQSQWLSFLLTNKKL